MIYLSKASAILIIFYIVYKLWLQKETFFQQNRIFLLIGFFTALIIPFVTIPIYVEQTLLVGPAIISSNPLEVSLVAKSIDWIQIAFYVYLCGVAFFSIKFIIALLSLRKLINSGIKDKIDNEYHVRLAKDTLPFSFFKYIVYNPAQFEANELKQIIKHEQVHARQYHSIDVQIAQVFSILFWFNPIIWLYKKEIRQNLEFIADSIAKSNPDNKNNYQELLLKLSFSNYPLTITNNFYTSLIKKRIIMLHKKESRRINQLKPMLILPILVLFIFAFNSVTIAQSTSTPEVGISEQEQIIKGKITDVDGKPIQDGSIIIKGTQRGGSTNSNGEFMLKASKGNVLVFSKRGMLTQEVTIDKPTYIHVFLRLDKAAIKTESKEDLLPLYIFNSKMGLKPLYIVDGIYTSYSAARQIPKDQIYSMNVLKGISAINNYGEKGKNGVVIITTKIRIGIGIKITKIHKFNL